MPELSSQQRATPYKPTTHLSGGHSNGITRVAFNPAGSLLASAGLDGTVCIWDTATWSLLDVYYAKTRITAVAWYTDDNLVCGLADGSLSALVKDGNDVTHVSGFWAHRYPVEHLSVRGNMVATGAHEELSVWNWDSNPMLACVITSLPPPVTEQTDTDSSGDDGEDERPDEEQLEVLVTSLSWASSHLIATYLNHGIRLFDIQNWKNVRVIDTTPIVSASLSPNGAFLAASQVGGSFYVYDLDSGKVIRTFLRDVTDKSRAVPVLFVHGGHAIACGSTEGTVRIWYVDSGIGLEPLHIPKGEKVLALAAHYYAASDRFLIATGAMNEHAPSSIVIWTAGGDQTAAGQSGVEVEVHESIYQSSLVPALVYCSALFIVVFAVASYVLSEERWGASLSVARSHYAF
ncbi:WD40 repeat-like protein [Lentinus brumalis]|uniref:WD40 repeat-like protein n=1 Tax=Lentinus brumalis TaxID=2498619 RepID=A0A371D4F5_9APHY|nr:WD40 repeat-like protein [Polyporus brumalis]